MKSDDMDYLYYLVDTISLTIAMIFSLSQAYAAVMSGQSYLKEITLVGVAWFLRYIYLIFYFVTKFALV